MLGLLALVAGPPLSAQSVSSDRLLRGKRILAERELRALAETSVGVRTSEGITPDLFRIRSTGVPTAQLVEAAQAFLATLTPTQTLRAHFAVDDLEWRRWCNVDNGIYLRQGVSLREMTAPQQKSARDLLRAPGGAPSRLMRRTLPSSRPGRLRGEDVAWRGLYPGATVRERDDLAIRPARNAASGDASALQCSMTSETGH